MALDDKIITLEEMNSILSTGEELGKQLIGFSKSLSRS
jgi:hypothetical protein